MVTTADRVWAYLARDLVLAEGLARGIGSTRRAARWLIDSQGWATTEDAVVSALRRSDPDPGVDLGIARNLLGEARVTVQTGLATVNLPNTREYRSLLPEIVETLYPEHTPVVFRGGSGGRC